MPAANPFFHTQFHWFHMDVMEYKSGLSVGLGEQEI